MRKISNGLLIMLIIFLLFAGCHMSVDAASASDMKFQYELSVDGKDTKEVKPGDIITVVLKLQRSDKAEPYTMHAMQAEIRYDSTFLELVEDSAVLSPGIVSTDVAMVDRYHEFYMNFLSLGGGKQWESNELIGSFQLKVVGEKGVTAITCEDYLVSLPDGAGSYDCDANELLIILSTDCVVSFHTNGGSEIEDLVVQFEEKIAKPEDSIREGYVLEGWYTDIHLTEEWDFEEDTVEGNMSLYAKWVVEDMSVSQAQRTEKCFLKWITVLIIIILLILWCLRRKIKTEHG